MATVSLQVQTSQSSFMSLPPVLGGKKKQREIKLQNRSVTPPLFSTPVHVHRERRAEMGDPVCLRLFTVECVSLSFSQRRCSAGHARASAIRCHDEWTRPQTESCFT